MKLIVGLGNIGSQYAATRHNLGFMVIDQLIKTAELPESKENTKFKALISEGMLGDEKVILAKPTTMMNLSGEAIGALQRFYKTAPEDIWIVHDDLDLVFGKLRVRLGGGSAGHNGLKSIIEAVGENFGRFRIGISNTRLNNPVATDAFVLAEFDVTEQESLSSIISQTAKLVTDHLHAELIDTTYSLI
jgi:PTH1 family peptidyl-tRNA hydrolase